MTIREGVEYEPEIPFPHPKIGTVYRHRYGGNVTILEEGDKTHVLANTCRGDKHVHLMHLVAEVCE